MSAPELTRAECEAAELRAIEVRGAFLAELARHPALARLYTAAHLLEGRALEARRARREAELLEGAEP